MSLPQQVEANESPLAPELTETVRAARAELERAILEAKLTDDPIRHSLSAQSSVLDALHRLFVDGTLALSQTLRDAQRPAALVSPDTERELLDRVAKAVPPAVQRSLVSWHSWIDRKEARKAAAVVFVAFVLGYAACWVRTPIREIPVTWDYPATYPASDGAGLSAFCREHTFKVGGRIGCHQGDVWLDPAPPGKVR